MNDAVIQVFSRCEQDAKPQLDKQRC